MLHIAEREAKPQTRKLRAPIVVSSASDCTTPSSTINATVAENDGRWGCDVAAFAPAWALRSRHSLRRRRSLLGHCQPTTPSSPLLPKSRMTIRVQSRPWGALLFLLACSVQGRQMQERAGMLPAYGSQLGRFHYEISRRAAVRGKQEEEKEGRGPTPNSLLYTVHTDVLERLVKRCARAELANCVAGVLPVLCRRCLGCWGSPVCEMQHRPAGEVRRSCVPAGVRSAGNLLSLKRGNSNMLSSSRQRTVVSDFPTGSISDIIASSRA